jgi:hypothetical protein
MNEVRRLLLPLFLAALVVAVSPLTALAATAPLLGSAGNFAVLAGTTITNTGPSWVTGEIGASTAIGGFQAPAAPTGPGTSGVQHLGDAVYIGAETDLVTAYNSLSQPNTADYTNVNLGGLTLGPGVYNQTTAPVGGLTGTLTLNGPGIYIFKEGSTLITAAGTPGAPAARVVLINGAQPCDVFWQVATSATLFTYTEFIGTIMAGAGIQMQTGATLWGRALARTAGVTLDTNRIIQPSGCTTGLTTNYVAPAPVAAPVPNSGNLPASLGVIVTAGGGLDTTPPILSLPGNLTVGATGPAGAVVTYTVTATDPDNSPSSLTLTCAPASGSTFPIGTTTVNCSAVDPAGNQAAGSFTVTVLGAAAQLSSLRATVDGFNLQPGVSNSLDAKLAAANDSAVQRPNTAAACNQLGAFINEAQAQSGNMLTAQQANQLIAAAAQVQATLGC